MTNQWGSDDHGPGGDPSFGRETHGAEHSAPRFGEHARDGSDTGYDKKSPTLKSEIAALRAGDPAVRQRLRRIIFMVLMVVVALVFMRVFFSVTRGSGFGVVSVLILIFIVFPIMKLVTALLRRKLDD